jgi:hypothetical protein
MILYSNCAALLCSIQTFATIPDSLRRFVGYSKRSGFQAREQGLQGVTLSVVR